MSPPKPRETNRNLIQLVSLRQAEKSHRNLRNHFLKEGGELVSPLARASTSIRTVRLLRLRLRLRLGGDRAGRRVNSLDHRALQMTNHSAHPATMVEHIPAITNTKPRKEREIPRRVRQAVSLLLSGECTTQKAAAARVKLSPERLCRALKEAKIQAFIEREVASKLNGLQMKAAVGAESLLDARSEHVRAEMVKHLLAIGGHIAKTASNPLVHIDMQVGYVIDLSGNAPQQAPTIDLTPGEAAE